MNIKYETNYCLDENVFLFIQDDIAQILDFDRGEFYGLDRIATVMLSLVLEQGIKKTITEITQTYEVNEDCARADLTELLHNLEQKKLIIAQDKHRNLVIKWLQDQNQKAVTLLNRIWLWLIKKISFIIHQLLDKDQTPSYQTVELLLTMSWISFRILGWSRTITLWQHWHQDLGESKTSNYQKAIAKVDQIVREAAAGKLFLPMVCKERALVGYHILRTFYSLPATLVIGIERYPFQVHAWVECNGKIVTDDPEHCKLFIPVVSYS